MMRQPYHDIIPRDDNMFDVAIGDHVAGPFESRTFAMQVASGEKPAAITHVGGRFRRFRIVREAPNASA